MIRLGRTKVKKISIFSELEGNAYPGRGIVLGRSGDGKHAVITYFIMGRSGNSRNRIFTKEGEGIKTEAFDPSKLEDPSLIIYSPVRMIGNKTIVSNGDQTETIDAGLRKGLSLEQILKSRSFEPDAPNYTPRISALLEMEKAGMHYSMSILKSDEGNPDSCLRFLFDYENPQPGEGHFIHTYIGDGEPLKSFEGEPRKIEISRDLDEFSSLLWESLNPVNKISLFVRYINIEDLSFESRIFNKNQ